jgi:SAM-dependent methyltransferase
MKQDHRTPFHRALQRARVAAYAPGEFVGQESFMTAGEIRALAERAGVGPGAALLDLCCGVGGPATVFTRDLGARYLGVDFSPTAVDLARETTAGLPCRFAIMRVPPVPAGPFDVVVLLEAMLAFADKRPLVREVAAALAPGGRFAFTLEEGPPLSRAERAAMPDADTVWLTPLEEVEAALAGAGLAVAWVGDHSREHGAMAEALADAFAADGEAITGLVGRRGLADLVAAHRRWADWLGAGRVRKLSVIAERR